MNTINTFRCPNCSTDLSGEAICCPKCNASFEGPHAWKPLRDGLLPTIKKAAEDPTLKVLRILGYISLVFWPAFLLAAGMAFDAPNSEKHVLPYVAIFIAVAYGLLPFVVPAVARGVLRNGYRRLAIAIAALPISIVPLFTTINFFMYFITMATRR